VHQLYGYDNDWYTSYNSAYSNFLDLTYSFSYDEVSTIFASTTSSTTNFSTKIHIVKVLSSGSYRIVATNDDISGNHNKSNIYTVLPTGSYLIIVEGSDTNDTGRFNLTLSISSESNASGTIAHEGSWAKEGCSINLPITNKTSASTSEGVITYSRERKPSTSSDWIPEVIIPYLPS